MADSRSIILNVRSSVGHSGRTSEHGSKHQHGQSVAGCCVLSGRDEHDADRREQSISTVSLYATT